MLKVLIQVSLSVSNGAEMNSIERVFYAIVILWIH